MTQLNGMTAIITGASRGIGAETARVFAQAGANVVLIARSQAAIDELATEIGPKALSLACDVADFSLIEAAVAQSIAHFGRVDILVNNAGIIEPISHLATSDPAAWGHVIDVNVKGVYNGMRAVLPSMIANGAGTILTISSGAAHGPTEAWSHYNASKAAVNMLTRCVDMENRANGIRAIGLSPGTVATRMQQEIKTSGINPISQLDWSVHIPPDWPAKTLLWMCSPQTDAWLGGEISLRNPDIRKAVGLI
ncbi:MAG: NAD(P)-dependent dehydrogenase (short-subunit alcohol dehydrogenase family) [Paracoccaceae bacterium]|jgi:NAD(P)-dependent dehydrogenase (short-subunit alcohol dehydrogenase family)